MPDEKRLPDRLSRRERNLPILTPDDVDAIAASLADWGAEHRPDQPCNACGCTLYWTAAGADMRTVNVTIKSYATMHKHWAQGAALSLGVVKK
jgi:hypothetical protein